MNKLIFKCLRLSPVVLAATLSTAGTAFAEEIKSEVTSVSELSAQQQLQADNSMGQVTSVSQFSDVQPTDWAFQALQSLVERYGCIAGYPNGTYRGNRALTRYEFAAGLNACLDRVNELIATATADLVTKQDLATLQRLQEEFSAELATLRGRVDALEARTAELEANQFSTTTKLKGEAIFNLTNAFGDQQADTDDDENNNPDLDSNTTFANRVRLSLESSFTGSDNLQVRLQARNIQPNSDETGTDMTRLGFDGDNGNDVEIDKINYAFDLGPARIKIDANGAEVYENINNFNPNFKSSGSGAISRYGRFSPIYRLGDGGAGVTASFEASDNLTLSAAYLSPNASSPEDPNGAFNGSNAVFGQIDFKPSDSLNIGFTYARAYQNGGDIDLTGSTGSGFAQDPFRDRTDPDAVAPATVSNNYGIQAAFKPSSKITVGGWAGLADTTARSGDNDGADADLFYWGAHVGIKDVGRKGNLFGVIFGQPPKVTDNDIAANEDPDTSYHLETLYKFQVNDKIAVTPGLLVIFNPEHNDNNDTIYVGTLRTTFKF
ncbi:iron uptake porin [Mastigocoleus sp. MO_188.B34]|uniref:iron uptake porin n=1 Tax=Mastigocoleus sp. MO_188.B34 TaxID=3036635 RepID=UPI00260613A6|nr:iron uptake porin [Mastigocoleus sp. MO_188.B34]MDJ0697053.1 iron uptake porin [Mastigocoleus sp. MO_188.B34]